MRVLILGAGAVGGYLGGRLIQAGTNVAFIARGQRLQQLKSTGLVIKSPLGDMASPVAASHEPDPAFTADVIMLTCKAHDLDESIATITPAVQHQTRILPFLNGLQHLEKLSRHFPENEIWCGIAHGAITLRTDGTIDHLSPFFSAIIGTTGDTEDRAIADLVDVLKNADADVRLSPNILQDAWNKFVFLATLAGVTCLMRADVGTILRTRFGPDLVKKLFSECMSVARSEGFPPDKENVRSYLGILTQEGSNLTSSMLRDVESGKATEYDHIFGDMLRRAARHGLDTPILATCHAHLACYEARR